MSNKETLQGYNETLSQYNTNLDDILNTINNLPENENLTEELDTYNNEVTEQEVTIDTILKTLRTKAIRGGGSMNNYSTEEMVIGTWIDGQPLYQRTFEITTTTTDTRKYLSDELGLTNLKNVWIDESASFIDYNGITKTGIQSVNTFLSTSDYKTCYIDADGRLALKTGSGANMTLYWTVTLRYTKTTD